MAEVNRAGETYIWVSSHDGLEFPAGTCCMWHVVGPVPDRERYGNDLVWRCVCLGHPAADVWPLGSVSTIRDRDFQRSNCVRL